MRASNLKTEHLTNPRGIDSRAPYLSWICEDGTFQTAYEIEVTCKGMVLWNSGKISSGQMYAVFPGPLRSRGIYTWRVRLWDETEEAGPWSQPAVFEAGLLEKKDWKAKWIDPELSPDPAVHQPASYLRTSFFLDPDSQTPSAAARLYITARGLYEAWINGRRVGDFVLAPGSYAYDKRLAYQTYDVTALLKPGENQVQVILGDGWYRSVSGVDGDRNLYGEHIGLLFQLEVNGEAVCVSDESWEASQQGPLRENDMQQGETVDARIPAPKQLHRVKLAEEGNSALICSNCLPICEAERFPGRLFTTPNGERVIDFGQNLAGYVEFTVYAREGEKLILTHGETLDENGNFTQENFQDRKRHKEGGTRQQVIYTCREGENHYKTKFSIWGFRYAKLEGTVDTSRASFTAIAVYSRMEQLTEFSCGVKEVEQLVHNSIWSQKSNFCDVPTDCPTRERAAWTGDMGVFAHTGLYFMDAYPVIRKWLGECRLAQYEDGRIANIAPRNNRPSFFSGLLAGSTGWGDACILVPYAMYQRYGDRGILEENFEMMQRWYAYLERRAGKSPLNPLKRYRKNPYRKYTIETGIDYGEWCEPGVDSTSAMRTPQGKVATAYLSYSGRILAKIAALLDRPADAAHYQEVSNKAALAWRHIATENGKIISDRQAEYVRALSFGLLEGAEARQAAADLNQLVIRCGYHLNTGFLSTPYLPGVLCAYGYEDTAYKLLLQDTCPGWLYAVRKGATTIWENWDGINEKGEVKASFNHYSYGAVCGWLIDSVCGIRLEEGRVSICPHPNKALGKAKAVYRSPYGTIACGWQYEEDKVIYQITIPVNVRAQVSLPGRGEMVLGPGRHQF